MKLIPVFKPLISPKEIFFLKSLGKLILPKSKKIKQKVGIITRKIIVLLQFRMEKLVSGLSMDVKILQVITKRIK